MENAFTRFIERRALVDDTRSEEEVASPQGCAGRSGRDGCPLL